MEAPRHQFPVNQVHLRHRDPSKLLDQIRNFAFMVLPKVQNLERNPSLKTRQFLHSFPHLLTCDQLVILSWRGGELPRETLVFGDPDFVSDCDCDEFLHYNNIWLKKMTPGHHTRGVRNQCQLPARRPNRCVSIPWPIFESKLRKSSCRSSASRCPSRSGILILHQICQRCKLGRSKRSKDGVSKVKRQKR